MVRDAVSLSLMHATDKVWTCNWRRKSISRLLFPCWGKMRFSRLLVTANLDVKSPANGRGSKLHHLCRKWVSVIWNWYNHYVVKCMFHAFFHFAVYIAFKLVAWIHLLFFNVIFQTSSVNVPHHVAHFINCFFKATSLNYADDCELKFCFSLYISLWSIYFSSKCRAVTCRCKK